MQGFIGKTKQVFFILVTSLGGEIGISPQKSYD